MCGEGGGRTSGADAGDDDDHGDPDAPREDVHAPRVEQLDERADDALREYALGVHDQVTTNIRTYDQGGICEDGVSS